MKHLKPEHLLKDGSDTLWIRKPREKTGNMCNVPILSPAKAIIDKYSDHPLCLKNGVLLPVLTNQKMNSYLKEIADLCGITKRLTTHIARHKDNFCWLLIKRLCTIRFSIGNDLETSLVLRYA